MKYVELYRQLSHIWGVEERERDIEIESRLVTDVLNGEHPEIELTYGLPSEVPLERDEIVIPEHFELQNHSIVRDMVGRYNIFVEATVETQVPVEPPEPRPLAPSDYRNATLIYHIRGNVTPSLGSVSAKVFMAFEGMDY